MAYQTLPQQLQTTQTYNGQPAQTTTTNYYTLPVSYNGGQTPQQMLDSLKGQLYTDPSTWSTLLASYAKGNYGPTALDGYTGELNSFVDSIKNTFGPQNLNGLQDQINQFVQNNPQDKFGPTTLDKGDLAQALLSFQNMKGSVGPTDLAAYLADPTNQSNFKSAQTLLNDQLAQSIGGDQLKKDLYAKTAGGSGGVAAGTAGGTNTMNTIADMAYRQMMLPYTAGIQSQLMQSDAAAAAGNENQWLSMNNAMLNSALTTAQSRDAAWNALMNAQYNALTQEALTNQSLYNRAVSTEIGDLDYNARTNLNKDTEAFNAQLQSLISNNSAYTNALLSANTQMDKIMPVVTQTQITGIPGYNTAGGSGSGSGSGNFEQAAPSDFLNPDKWPTLPNSNNKTSGGGSGGGGGSSQPAGKIVTTDPQWDTSGDNPVSPGTNWWDRDTGVGSWSGGSWTENSSGDSGWGPGNTMTNTSNAINLYGPPSVIPGNFSGLNGLDPGATTLSTWTTGGGGDW